MATVDLRRVFVLGDSGHGRRAPKVTGDAFNGKSCRWPHESVFAERQSMRTRRASLTAGKKNGCYCGALDLARECLRRSKGQARSSGIQPVPFGGERKTAGGLSLHSSGTVRRSRLSDDGLMARATQRRGNCFGEQRAQGATTSHGISFGAEPTDHSMERWRGVFAEARYMSGITWKPSAHVGLEHSKLDGLSNSTAGASAGGTFASSDAPNGLDITCYSLVRPPVPPCSWLYCGAAFANRTTSNDLRAARVLTRRPLCSWID
jgi:hypothetical protein